MIEVKVDNAEVLAALERLSKAAANPRPVLVTIAERLVESTKSRFESSTAPDGSRWAANSQATYLAYLGSAKSLHRKDGRVNAKGSAKVIGKKPLIGESGNLSKLIHSRVTNSGLAVGSTMEYAAMQQFGGRKKQFPNLWGDIPARPFLGVSDEDASEILSVVNDYLRRAV